MTHPVERYVAFFEGLAPPTLGSLNDLFSEQARFVDPFNDVRGREAIRRVFEHMFATCDTPRFKVEEKVCDGPTCYLRWTFSFGSARRQQQITGISRVQFRPDGRVDEHIDYWDPAGQLYETIPFFGTMFRFLRRRLRAPQSINTQQDSDSSLATER